MESDVQWETVGAKLHWYAATIRRPRCLGPKREVAGL